MLLEPRRKVLVGVLAAIFWPLLGIYYFGQIAAYKLESIPLYEGFFDAFWLFLPAILGGFVTVLGYSIWASYKRKQTHSVVPPKGPSGSLQRELQRLTEALQAREDGIKEPTISLQQALEGSSIEFCEANKKEALQMIGWADESPDRITVCVAEMGFSELDLHFRKYKEKIDIRNAAKICNESDKIHCIPAVPLCLIPRRYFREDQLSEKDKHKLEGKLTSFLHSTESNRYQYVFFNFIVCGDHKSAKDIKNIIEKAVLNYVLSVKEIFEVRSYAYKKDTEGTRLKKIMYSLDC